METESYYTANKNKWFYRICALLTGMAMFFASISPAAAYTIYPPETFGPTEFNPVDITPPHITNLSVNPSSFNPKDDTTISFSLDKQASVTIKILSGSTTVKTIIQNLTLQGGVEEQYWDGKDSNGNYVTAGSYTVQVTASNAYGTDTETTTVTVYYPSQGSAPNISNLTVTPTTFDPKTTKAAITFSLDKQATATIKVFNGSSLVRTIISGASLSAMTHTYFWDGKDSSDNYVTAGSYTVQVTASNAYGATTKSANVTVSYQGQSTVLDITNYYASPSMFDPNTQSTTIYYTLNKFAYVTVKIMKGTTLIKTLKSGVYEQSGSAVWDGRYSGSPGAIVGEGTYTYEIDAFIGTETDMAAGNVIVQYGTVNPPTSLQITSHSVYPTTFDPYQTSATVYYTLNKAAYVTIRIKNNGSIVKTIQTSTFGYSGGATWDGRNLYGDVVAEGTYQYEIAAYLDNANVTATGYVTVDIGYPNNDYGTPWLSYASVSPSPFNPYTTNTQLTYTLSGGNANVTVEVYDRYGNYGGSYYGSYGKLIKTLKSGVREDVGTHYITWNGRDSSETVVKEGTYTFKITASNSYGTDTRNADVVVSYSAEPQCIDGYYCPVYNTKPYIYKDYASPNPFRVGGGNTTTIYFAVTTSAKVTVTISKDNNLIRTLQTDGYVPAGASFVKWDGKDYKGNYVSVGTYMYKIYAENSYGSDSKSDYIYVTATVGQIVPCGGYTDINVSSPYCKAILEMSKLGIFQGYPDGTFGAYNPINRAETVKVVLRALNKPISLANGSDAGFFDVSPSAWYMNYLFTARMMNIINGYPDGSFKPAKTVNRVELLKIFLEATGTYLPECSYAPYTDTPVAYNNTPWYLPYACYAKKYTLVDTDQYGNLNPGQPMKRGDVADLFYRYQMQNLFNQITNPPRY